MTAAHIDPALISAARDTARVIASWPKPTPLDGHTLGVRLVGTTVELTIHCHEPNGARCRKLYDESVTIDIPECQATAWMGKYIAEYIDWPCDTAESDFPLYDGMPIHVRWDGIDTWIWSPHKEGSS